MINLIQAVAEKTGLDATQAEKVLGGTFTFIKMQLKGDYQKIVSEIPEAATLGGLYMNEPVSGTPNTEEGLSKMIGGQFAQMMKMMTEYQKMGISQGTLQKLTPIVFGVICSRLSDNTKTLMAEKMPMFKDMINGTPNVQPPGFGALMGGFFNKKS
jgi:hypothetical protein